MKLIVLVALLAITGNSQAMVSAATASKLLQVCTDADENLKWACKLYVQGVAEATEIGGSTLTDPERLVLCIDGLSAEQLAKIFIEYAKNRPEKMDFPAVIVVQGSFIRAGVFVQAIYATLDTCPAYKPGQ